jgi:hypothetical protein
MKTPADIRKDLQDFLSDWSALQPRVQGVEDSDDPFVRALAVARARAKEAAEAYIAAFGR